MTIHTTANYHIAYCDADTALIDLADATYQAATTIDAALGRGGIAPPDATSLAAETAARQAADSALDTRLTTVEGRAVVAAATTSVTGWAAAANWTLAGIRARKIGYGFAYLSVTVTYTGAGITPSANGDTSNTTILSAIPSAWYPLENVSVAPYSSGRMWAGQLNSAGSLVLSALTNSTALATNDQLSATFVYPLATP